MAERAVGQPIDIDSLQPTRHNLPVQLTTLIGREREVVAVRALLQRPEVRLVTLTGTGGVGKTRLGLQVASELLNTFSDGVCFVSLAPLSDPDLVVPTIAETLGIREIGGRILLDLLKAYLYDRSRLLLLDNFEQVLAASTQVADLLVACPQLKVLVTSRATLHVRGEQEYDVPSLALPDPKHLPDLMALSQYEAVALFLQRAGAVKPDFRLNDANAATIAEICIRLDGLPLAIELAAARLKMFPPAALLARLEHRLHVLTGGARDAPLRQQTLRNTIAWSYHLLDTREQQLFRRISVFVDGATLEAIEALYTAPGDEQGQLLDEIASLIDKSLLWQGEQETEEVRFVMLETIREYGFERLAASGELEATQRAFAAYYLQLAEDAMPNVEYAAEQRSVDRLEQERENLRMALDCLLEWGETELASRLGGALGGFWKIRCHFGEGYYYLEQILARSEATMTPVRARALESASLLARYQGDQDRAEIRGRESLAVYRQLGDEPGIASSLSRLGGLAWKRGNLEESRTLNEESVALTSKMGDKQNIFNPLYNLGITLGYQGEYTRSRAVLEETLAVSRELGWKVSIARALFRLAWVMFISQGDTTIVRPLLEESLVLFKEARERHGMACILDLSGQVSLYLGDAGTARTLIEASLALHTERGNTNDAVEALSNLVHVTGCTRDDVPREWHAVEAFSHLAHVIAFQGDLAAALLVYEDTLTAAREIGDRLITAFALEGLVAVVASQGVPVWAARLLGAAEALREAIGTSIPPAFLDAHERSVASIRTRLGERSFVTAWAEGRSMTPEQVFAAQGSVTKLKPVPTKQSSSFLTVKSPPTYPDGLTTREVEVLRYIAQGWTDARIAEQLVISPRTVNTHLTSIYSKIQVSTRSGATRYAMEHRLV